MSKYKIVRNIILTHQLHKHKHLMRNIVIFILLQFISSFTAISANNTDKAEIYYNAKDYTKAIASYNQLATDSASIKSDPSYASNLFYNLGNCYYRTKEYAQAVFAYQQSLRYNPSNQDARFNLKLTQSKLQDQFDEPSSMIFSIMLNSVILSLSSTAWGWIALILLVTAILSFFTFKKVTNLTQRKVTFSISLILIISSLTTLTFAYLEQNHTYSFNQGVIMQEAQAYSTPSTTSKIIRTIHDGVLINILTTQSNGWQQVELPDGSTCWINTPNVAMLK